MGSTGGPLFRSVDWAKLTMDLLAKIEQAC